MVSKQDRNNGSDQITKGVVPLSYEDFSVLTFISFHQLPHNIIFKKSFLQIGAWSLIQIYAAAIKSKYYTQICGEVLSTHKWAIISPVVMIMRK